MDTVSKSEQEPVGEEDRASMDEQVEEDVEAEEANAQEHSHDGDQNAGKKKKKKKKKKKSSKAVAESEEGRSQQKEEGRPEQKEEEGQAAGASPSRQVGDSTLLHVASLKGDEKAVDRLIAARCNVDQARESGTTLLFIAAMNGHVAVVDSLVAARCKISQAKEVNGCLMEGWMAPLHCTSPLRRGMQRWWLD